MERAGRWVQCLPVSQRWVLVQLGRVGQHRRRQGRGDEEEDLGLHFGVGLLVVMVLLVVVVAGKAVVEMSDVDAELWWISFRISTDEEEWLSLYFDGP